MTIPTLRSSLLIITENFYPSTGATAQLLVDLADALASKGIRLSILTSTPGECSSRPAYTIFRTPQIRLGHNTIIAKLLQGLVFFFSALSFLVLYKKATYDKVLIVSNPPFIALLAPLSKFLTRKEFYFLQQDLFPRSAVLAGIVPSTGPLRSTLDSLMRASYRSTSRTIVLNTSMQKTLQHSDNIDSVVIHNWAVEGSPSDCSSNPLAKDWGLENKFIVQYAGNFGRLHEILTILEASRLIHDTSICFLFIGRGSKLDQIKAYKRNYSLHNIIIKDYVPREQLRFALSMADMSLISLIPGAEDAVAPSKFYGIIASGKPVLYIGSESADISHLIIKHNCGYTVAPGDCVELAQAIVEAKSMDDRLLEMGRNSSCLYQEKFGLDKALVQYIDILNLA